MARQLAQLVEVCNGSGPVVSQIRGRARQLETRFASCLIFTGYSLASYQLVITDQWIIARVYRLAGHTRSSRCRRFPALFTRRAANEPILARARVQRCKREDVTIMGKIDEFAAASVNPRRNPIIATEPLNLSPLSTQACHSPFFGSSSYILLTCCIFITYILLIYIEIYIIFIIYSIYIVYSIYVTL